MAQLEGFSYQLQQGVEDVRGELEEWEFQLASRSDPRLARLTLQGALDLVRRPSRNPREQDEVVLAIIRCCRERSARLWTPVLLEMLGPSLVAAATSIAAANRRADPVDIQQQLVLEAIRAAGTMPLRDSDRWILRRLSLQAASRTQRRLRREARYLVVDVDDPAYADRVAAALGDDSAVWDLVDLRLSNARADDLWLVAQIAVVGDDRETLARRLGISYRALATRYWRARSRLREQIVDDAMNVAKSESAVTNRGLGGK